MSSYPGEQLCSYTIFGLYPHFLCPCCICIGHIQRLHKYVKSQFTGPGLGASIREVSGNLGPSCGSYVPWEKLFRCCEVTPEGRSLSFLQDGDGLDPVTLIGVAIVSGVLASPRSFFTTHSHLSSTVAAVVPLRITIRPPTLKRFGGKMKARYVTRSKSRTSSSSVELVC